MFHSLRALSRAPEQIRPFPIEKSLHQKSHRFFFEIKGKAKEQRDTKGTFRDHNSYGVIDDGWNWKEIKEKIFQKTREDWSPIKDVPLLDKADSVAYVPVAEEDEVVTENEPDYPQIHQAKAILDPEPVWPAPGYPAPRPPKINLGGYANGFGRRKSARALVAVRAGTGRITINGKNWVEYFRNIYVRGVMLEPVIASEKYQQVDIKITAKGGGFMGQSYAIRHALAHALVARDPELHYLMVDSKFSDFDYRVKERKHTGRRGARKKQQWVKR